MSSLSPSLPLGPSWSLPRSLPSVHMPTRLNPLDSFNLNISRTQPQIQLSVSIDRIETHNSVVAVHSARVARPVPSSLLSCHLGQVLKKKIILIVLIILLTFWQDQFAVYYINNAFPLSYTWAHPPTTTTTTTCAIHHHQRQQQQRHHHQHHHHHHHLDGRYNLQPRL